MTRMHAMEFHQQIAPFKEVFLTCKRFFKNAILLFADNNVHIEAKDFSGSWDRTTTLKLKI